MKKAMLILLLLSLISAPVAFAGDVWESAQSPEYGKKAGGMLGRGFVNVATCFMDLIVQTVEGTQAGPPFVGTMTGLGGGLGCSALRVTSGALDVLTFWVPGFNGIPVGRSYSNCLEEVPGTAASDSGTYASPSVQEQAPASRKSSSYDYVKK